MALYSSRYSLRPQNTNFANDCLEYLGKYEAICGTALALESGPYREDCLMKKTEGRKSRDTVPLKNHMLRSLIGSNCMFCCSNNVCVSSFRLIICFELWARKEYVSVPCDPPRLLKGPWHEIFDLCFFCHQTTPPRPQIHWLKPFLI
jgi:hypothetical protein